VQALDDGRLDVLGRLGVADDLARALEGLVQQHLQRRVKVYQVFVGAGKVHGIDPPLTVQQRSQQVVQKQMRLGSFR